MINTRFIGWLVLGLVIVCFNDCLAQNFSWENIAGENSDLSAVLIDDANPGVIYLGAQGAILKTADSGQSWRPVLNIRGQSKAVNFLLFGTFSTARDSDAGAGNSIYAATGNGLFYSVNEGKRWQRVFKRADYLENECTTLGGINGVIYLGTKKGLFVSRDNAKTWDKQEAGLSDKHILSIVVDKRRAYIYAVCAGAVYRNKQGCGLWEKVFVGHTAEDTKGQEEEPDDYNEERESGFVIRYITVDNNSSYIYLSTSRGIYRSVNNGLDWELMSDYGLFGRDIKLILVSADSAVYAATKSAIFRFDAARWNEVSFGLSSRYIRLIALDKKGSLYAVCDNGLFRAKPDTAGFKTGIKSLYCSNEPDIAEVQKAAIKYAEVEPEKIMNWRKQAAKRALLPSINVGIDRDTSDLLHWESGSTTKAYDDILMTGKDIIGWDVSLSWDLGELVWNNDQTSIDARSRLMVQLRQDILDEVTKLYFERIRVKIELDNLSIEDRKKRFEKELKLKELTALLDGLTGGYFSNSVRQKNI